MSRSLAQLIAACSTYGSQQLGTFAQVIGQFLNLAGCAIFAPQVTPFRRLVIFVLLIVLVISVYRAPAILHAVEPLIH